jgi:hypothetical protein
MLEEPTRLQERAPGYSFLILIGYLWLYHTVDLRRQKSSFTKSRNLGDEGPSSHWPSADGQGSSFETVRFEL